MYLLLGCTCIIYTRTTTYTTCEGPCSFFMSGQQLRPQRRQCRLIGRRGRRDRASGIHWGGRLPVRRRQLRPQCRQCRLIGRSGGCGRYWSSGRGQTWRRKTRHRLVLLLWHRQWWWTARRVLKWIELLLLRWGRVHLVLWSWLVVLLHLWRCVLLLMHWLLWVH